MFKIDNFVKGIQHTNKNIFIEKNSEKVILFKKRRILESEHEIEEAQEVICEMTVQELKDLENEFQMDSDNPEDLKWKEAILWDKNTFEAAVQIQSSSSRFYYLGFDKKRYEVNEHNYEIFVSKASKRYMFAMLCNCGNCTTEDFDIGPMRRNSSSSVEIFSLEEYFDNFRIQTVKINSEKEHSKRDFNRLIHSYLFNISYNFDVTLFIKNSFVSERILRRTRRTGQIFPYKAYKQELTKYYHQAVAIDIPFTQYLAFYHVAEYFFQIISEQDAFAEIEDFITRPSFSPYKKEDIKQFYNKIKKKMKEQRDDGVWNEKTGLLLCLKKYIPDIESLRNAIHSIDNTAVEYYKNSEVEFADDSKKINFEDHIDTVYRNICDRVYSVRNAIVHSKEGDKLRYEPFKNDKQLAKEIPLIRSIAEEIIINSAESINLG